MTQEPNESPKTSVYAIAAIAIPATVAVAFIVLFITFLFDPVSFQHENAVDISCASNLKMIGLSMQIYAEDNDDFLPDSLDNSYIREVVGSDKTFVCPYCQKTGEKYTLLPGVGGKKLKDFDNPKETPVIICRHHRK